MNMNPAAIRGVFGVSGLSLTKDEADFYREFVPFGMILFKRNCASPDQVKELTASFRELTGWAEAPVLIDEEGGKVERMQDHPDWKTHPEFEYFGKKYVENTKAGVNELEDNIDSISEKLRHVGINVVCSPVLDLRYPGSSSVIGDRSFSSDPEVVSVLGRTVIDKFMDNGIIPVVKHSPGHGRAVNDSHKTVSEIDTPLSELSKTDFLPFRELSDAPMVMTAHLIYKGLDPENPITVSARGIKYIRETLGTEGVIISDCIHMNALKGAHAKRAQDTINAGVDLVLNSHGQPSAMRKVAETLPKVDPENTAFKKLIDFLNTAK